MPLPPLPTLRDIIRLYGLSAKKQLSQNFILDLNLTDKIVNASGSLSNATVLEIGPGPGSLTRSILKKPIKKLVAIEKDRRFQPVMDAFKDNDQRFSYRIADILETNEASVLGLHKSDSKFNRLFPPQQPGVENEREKLVFIGNLPFGVATELLLKWLKNIHLKNAPFDGTNDISLVLMFQTEVARRICAQPGSSDYGRLSVMSQRLCNVKSAFDIPAKAFVPEPKVTATVVTLEPRETPIGASISYETFELIVKKMFGERRKTLVNSLYDGFDVGNERAAELGEKRKEHFSVFVDMMQNHSHLDPKIRPHQLSVEQIVDLANLFRRHYLALVPQSNDLSGANKKNNGKNGGVDGEKKKLTSSQKSRKYAKLNDLD